MAVAAVAAAAPGSAAAEPDAAPGVWSWGPVARGGCARPLGGRNGANARVRSALHGVGRGWGRSVARSGDVVNGIEVCLYKLYQHEDS